jgi:aminoglycoside phosphotransferase (APT) family kinase protein
VKQVEVVLASNDRVTLRVFLKVDHVFVERDAVTGIIDWSEASRGDAHADLATLTLGHPEHLDDVLAGYGADVDRDRIRA